MRFSPLRLPARTMSRRVVLTILCGVAIPKGVSAEEPPKPSSGEVRLANGRAVEYTIHYDRNSLRDSVRLGNNLIAVTTSGALLRFELPAVHLVRERIDAEGVTCLGRGEGATILAGFGDGRVCRVDPVTLALTDMAKLPAPARWVGWCQAQGNRPAGLVVVTRPTRPVGGFSLGLALIS